VIHFYFEFFLRLSMLWMLMKVCWLV